MPVEVRRLDLGSGPTRTVTRGPLAGQEVPKYEVILPGWQDIIRVQPTASLTPAEAAIERQRRAARLNRSPTPEVLTNLSKIGQAVDDVQDAAVTLSLAGRILTKLSGKLIPGVGAISTVADVLNVVNIFYPKAAGQAVVGAATRAGGKLSGRKKYLASKEVKRALGLAPDASLSTYLRRLEETVKSGKVNVGLGELLQVGQTAEALTGYGIALGPIFGGIQDTVAGFWRGARFDFSGPLSLASQTAPVSSFEHMAQFAPGEYAMYRARAEDLARQQGLKLPVDPASVRKIIADNPVRVQVDWPGGFTFIDRYRNVPKGTTEANLTELLAPLERPLNVATQAGVDAVVAVKAATAKAATKTFDALKWLVGVRDDLSWDDHIEITCAQILAAQELLPFTAAADYSIPVAFHDREMQEPLPFCGDRCSHPRDAGSVANCLARGPGKFRFDWIDEAPTADARDFTAALIDRAAEVTLELVEGPQAQVRYDNGAAWRALWLLHEYNLLPPYDRDDSETFSFFDSLIALMNSSTDKNPSFEQVRLLYLSRFAGVVLD